MVLVSGSPSSHNTRCVAKGHTELLCVTRKVYLTVFAEEFAQHNVEALKFLLHDVQLFHVRPTLPASPSS